MTDNRLTPDAFTLGLLAAAGIPSDHVVGVEYSHNYGEVPTLIVRYLAHDMDTAVAVKCRFVLDGAPEIEVER